MSKTVLHDLRVEATIACDERGASVPASRLRCSCGFYTEAVMEADAYVLNLMAQHHLEAVSRLHHWRRNHGRG